jgi:ribose transport system permease protein
MASFIITLASMNIFRGIALLISNSKLISVNSLGMDHVNQKIFGIPLVLIIFVVLILLFDYLLRHTKYGRNVLAIGNDKILAAKIGINVNKNILVSFIICGVLSSICGVLLSGQIGAVSADFGTGNEFIIISATVLGGTSLFGGKGKIFPNVIIGITLVILIMNGLAMVSADPYLYIIVRGIVLFLAVALDSINYKGELR